MWLPMRRTQLFGAAYTCFVLERRPESLLACRNVGHSLWVAAATLDLTGMVALAARTRPRLVSVIAVIGVLEVMAYARYTRPTFDPRVLPARSAALRRLLDERAAGDARVAASSPFAYVAMGARASDLWGADPTVLGRYGRFLALTQGWPLDAIVVTSGIRKVSPLLGMLRLRYLVNIDRNEHMMLQPTRLPELPRALLVPYWRVLADGDQALEAMRDHAFDPSRLVLLERDPGLVPSDGDAQGSVTVRDVSTDVLEITADLPQPAILVVSDNYSASWQAMPLADSAGRAYDVMPANYILRGIPLGPGHHHFRLEYRPSALPIGVAMTLVTLAAGAAITARHWYATRRERNGVR